MTKTMLKLAVTLSAIAAVSGCQLCLLPCVVCAELSSPQLQMRAEPLPEVGPTFVAEGDRAVGDAVVPAK
jgi:hypothetical protein